MGLLQLLHATEIPYSCLGQIATNMQFHGTIFELYIRYGYTIYIIWLYNYTSMISFIFLVAHATILMTI